MKTCMHFEIRRLFAVSDCSENPFIAAALGVGVKDCNVKRDPLQGNAQSIKLYILNYVKVENSNCLCASIPNPK